MSNNCPYCNKQPLQVTGKEIYPHRRDLYSLSFWLCKDCNAYCGCHKGTNTPLGTLANEELRSWRKKCHNEFDFLWKEKLTTRTKAYEWMSNTLKIPSSQCHIAMFDIEQCKRLLSELEQGWERNTLPFLLGQKFRWFVKLGDFIPFYKEYYSYVVYKDVIPKKDFESLTAKDKKIELQLEFDDYNQFKKFKKIAGYY